MKCCGFERLIAVPMSVSVIITMSKIDIECEYGRSAGARVHVGYVALRNVRLSF